MAHFSLTLLGTFQATLDEQPVTGFQSNKVRALLAYLAVEADRPHSRPHLAGLLWPDWSDSAARTYLRQALLNLRRVLGNDDLSCPFLHITRQSVHFNRQSDHWLDVHQLLKALQGVDLNAPAELDQAAAAQLQDIVSLHQGSFLEGFFLEGCSQYDEWQALTREHLHRQMARAVKILVQTFERHGDLAQALHFAWRWVELEPWLDEAHRCLMALQANTGRAAAAAAHFDAYRLELDTELGLTPAPETTALYEQIKVGLQPSQGSGFTHAPAPHVIGLGFHSPPSFLASLSHRPSAPPLFVARAPEMARLDSLLDCALAGRGQVCFVFGDAGQGKTLLQREFARRAWEEHPDLIVAHGLCNAQTGLSDPYLPFREILATLTGDIEAQWAARTITRTQALHLWRLFPLVLRAIVDEGPDLVGTLMSGRSLLRRARDYLRSDTSLLADLARLVPEEAWRRPRSAVQQTSLFAQTSSLLQAIARQFPLLLILDDLQWADLGSISLLFHLGRAIQGSRVLILGGYRTEEVALGRNGVPHPLQSVVNEFRQIFDNNMIDLNRADASRFVNEFVDTIPNRLDKEFRDTLCRLTAGNPLFTIELLRAMQTAGDLLKDEAGQWVQRTQLDWTLLPERIEAVISQRMSRLPPEQREALTVASVEGESFTGELVATICGQDPRDLVRQFSSEVDRRHRLVALQGVRHVGDQRLSHYRFRHMMFQRFLYGQLDEAERAYYHEAVAQTIESFYTTDADELTSRAAQLAHHYERAALFSHAVPYRLLAGEQALRAIALTEALAHFHAGLDLVRQLPSTPSLQRDELTLKTNMATTLALLEGHGGSGYGMWLELALELAKKLENTAHVTPILFGLWDHLWVTGRYDDAQELAQTMLVRAAATPDDSAAAADAHLAAGSLALRSGSLTVALNHLSLGVALLEKVSRLPSAKGYTHDPDMMLQMYYGYALCFLGYLDQAQRALAAGLALARQRDHAPTKEFALTCAAAQHLFLNQPHETLRFSQNSLEIVQERGFKERTAWVGFVRSWSLVKLHNSAEALEDMWAAQRDFRTTGAKLWDVRLRTSLIDASLHLGHLSTAADLLAETLKQMEDTGERMLEADLYRMQGDLLRQKQRLHSTDISNCAIERSYRLAIEVAQEQNAKLWELRASAHLAEFWLEREKVAAAHDLLAPVFFWFTEGSDMPDLLAAQALLDRCKKPA